MAKDYKQYNYNATYCGGSFASQGCGPTSVADLLEKSPLEIADWMTRNGAATTDGHGTYWDGINRALTAYGADGKMLGSSMDGVINSDIFDRWRNHIQSGYEGVLLMHNVTSSYWTSSGHYIAIVGFKASSEEYLVYDPASVIRTGYHSWSDFVGNICCLYTSNLKWGSASDDTYTFTLVQIKGGDSGNAVLLLQKILYSRGMYSLKSGLDGAFGPKTTSAVKKYQKYINEHGGKLAVDGVCGPSTWSSLLGMNGSVSGANSTFTVKQVESGDNNVYVLLAQELLMAEGLYASTLDKNFGPATYRAVRDAQKKFGITVDGVCGPTTFKKLLKL